MKKTLALLLCAAMLLTVCVTAFAADGAIKVKDNGTFHAYQLLKATDGGDGKYAYTLNEKYAAILETLTGAEKREDIVSAINAFSASEMRDFADEAYRCIKEAKLSADAVLNGKESKTVAQGYWLVADATADSTDPAQNSAKSIVMVKTAGLSEVEISTKKSVPSVNKTVEDKNDSTGDSSWGKYADYDTGDEINFEVTGTVASNIGSFATYYYKIHDEMEGLTYVNGTAKVEVDGVDATDSFVITFDAAAKKLTAKCDDLLSIDGVNGNTQVVLTYVATLDDSAVAGSVGNKNTAYVEYANNPYYDVEANPENPGQPPEEPVDPKDPSKPTTSYTNRSTAVVFCYEIDVNKVDSAKNPLGGAGFTLYKYSAEAKDYVAVTGEMTGKTTFDFTSFDAGKYKLVETTVPEGFNRAADVEFTINATYKEVNGVYTIDSLTVTPADSFSIDADSGVVSVDIVNLTGAELPETGGIGTTIFYVLGGMMMLGAAVLLITKKRMSAEG